MLKRLFALAALLLGLALAAAPAFAQADFDLAVVRTTLNTTTGNQDITTADFGGGTPKAALFITADSVSGSGALGSIGATDCSGQWVVAWASGHSQSASAPSRRGAPDEVAMILSEVTGNVTAEANFVSCIANGVRINLGQADASNAYPITVVLLGGSDFSAKASTAVPNLTVGNSSNVSGVGFEATAALFASALNVMNDAGSTSAAAVSFGFVDNSGTIGQSGFQYTEFDDIDPTETNGTVYDNRVLGFEWAAGPGNRELEVTAFDSDGFDVTARSGDWPGTEFGYLAIRIDGGTAWAGVEDSPTTTGDHDFTSAGFLPQLGLLQPTMLTATNTLATNGNGSAWGVAAFTADAEASSSWAVEDNSATTDTETNASAAAVNLDSHTGADAFDATFVDFLSNGATLNFSAANGTTRKWPALFLGDGSGSASGSGGTSLIIVN